MTRTPTPKPTSNKIKSAARASTTRFDQRVEELSACISGDDGTNLLAMLRDDGQSIDAVVERIAASAMLEARMKLQRTGTNNISWVTEANFEYVGLPVEAKRQDFRSAFDEYFRARLGKRAEGFATLFRQLDDQAHPLIIETGCLRVPGNWDGDGQSTFQFDWYARERGGHVITIDANPASIDSARQACSRTTSTILNDSVSALSSLGSIAARPASLIYLDSFDLDVNDPMPSAVHHALEIMAARQLIGPGTIVAVDDYNVPPLGPGGKGVIVDHYMNATGAHVLYEGYQKIWRITA